VEDKKEEIAKEYKETLISKGKALMKEHKGVIALGLTTSVFLIPVFLIVKKAFLKKKQSLFAFLIIGVARLISISYLDSSKSFLNGKSTSLFLSWFLLLNDNLSRSR